MIGRCTAEHLVYLQAGDVVNTVYGLPLKETFVAPESGDYALSWDPETDEVGIKAREREVTIRISPGNSGLPGWTADICIPISDLAATQWHVSAFTRKRVITKAHREIRRYYANKAAVETIRVPIT